MSRFIPISRAFWISAIALSLTTACQNRAPSMRLLDTRAGYDAGEEDAEVALYQRGRHMEDSLAKRSSPRVVRVHIYGHELSSKDYFLGGDVLIRVVDDEWTLENDVDNPPLPAIVEIKNEKKKTAKKNPRKNMPPGKSYPAVENGEL